MLSVIEKSAVLKSVSVFARLPDELLVEIASRLEELQVKAGERILEEGDLRESLYIIVAGRVRVHEGEQTLNYLGRRDVFGAMAALGLDPRLASVTALEHTQLLRLDSKPLYELMDEHVEVARGIIRGLSQHLRARIRDMSNLRTYMERVVLPLGIALSTEERQDRLLERILLEAKSICNADGGTLYLRTEGNCLKFVRMDTDSLSIAVGGTTGKEVPFPPLPLYDAVTGEPNEHYMASCTALRGQSINVPDIYSSEEFDFSAAKDFDRQTGYHSLSSLTVPLKNHLGEVIGVLQLLNAQDPATGQVVPFDSYQQLAVESMASLAAVALNTQALLRRQQELLKFERDLQIGREIQAAFLPKELPQPPGWEIAGCFRPARQVAGDWYDVFSLPGNKIGLVIADVCDKGVGAALFMALCRSLIRAFAAQPRRLSWLDELGDDKAAAASNVSPRQRRQRLSAGTTALSAVEQTNNYIIDNYLDMNMFATLFFGVLDPSDGALTYVNGGHDPPGLVSPDGVVKARLLPTGPAVGMLAHIQFEIKQITLEPGDLLVAFTDGVPDARNPGGERFGVERLWSLLEQPAPSLEALLNRIEASLHAHMADTDQFDDITMLVVRRNPPE